MVLANRAKLQNSRSLVPVSYTHLVEVEVPPEVAEVLEHSQMQDELTAARIAAAENAAQ